MQVGRSQAYRQLLCEDLARCGLQDGVGERADALAAAVDRHAHAQSMQGLRQLQRNHPGPEHGDRLRQRLPGEDVVVDDQPIAGGLAPFGRHVRV
ncbi:MAG: hypothetical protein CAPSK01_000655 [Candidatus Accumulibacter vicinus]|uniref:Uncharacterized protein n=1 Tax=Candidatus Accumulibacter vicinus TaxID=2954382 RepID=A0A084Y4F2_9PROT|nr:MAG: hypothetical protein CAPSK01_000655 [Candidatus Accumulibacter vicinus]